MSKRKHLKKIYPVPRTDANQGAIEHIERVRKEREYVARKIAEYQAKQELAAEEARRRAQSTASQTLDGLQQDDDTSATVQ